MIEQVKVRADRGDTGPAESRHASHRRQPRNYGVSAWISPPRLLLKSMKGGEGSRVGSCGRLFYFIIMWLIVGALLFVQKYSVFWGGGGLVWGLIV